MVNEKRLIYLEDAISVLEKDVADCKDALKTAYYGEKAVIQGEIDGVRSAIHLLKQHASHGGTVEAVPVVHGRWIQVTPFSCDCSVCGKGRGGLVSDSEENFCKKCGAKMDGGRRPDGSEG